MFLFTLLIALAVAIAFHLDHVLLEVVGLPCILIAIADSILILHMLLNYSSEYAATNGSYQWICCSWLILIKLMIFYYYVFWQEDPFSEVAELARGFKDSFFFQASIFATPALYALWMFRAAYQLFGPPHKVLSVESIIHMDIIFHVVIDLLDLLIAFSFCYSRSDLVDEHQWIVHLNACVVAACWFMHSYSFPTGASKLPALQSHRLSTAISPVNPESDVFLTRKHVALVSIFIVDCPLLFVRMFIWVHYPLKPGLQPFLFKNVVNIPLSTFRLNQCRTAEKSQLAEMTGGDVGGEKPSLWLPRGPRPTRIESPTSLEDLRDETITTTDAGAIDPGKGSDSESGSSSSTANFKSLIPLPPDPTLTPYRLQQLLEQLECQRTIPVHGFSWKMIIKKVFRTLIYGHRQSLPSRLNNIPPLPTLPLIRICILIVMDCLWSLVTVTLHLFPFSDDDLATDDGPLALRERGWIWMSVLCGGYCVVHFLCTVGSAPGIDVALTSVGWTVSCLCYWQVISAVRLSALFNFELPLWQEWATTSGATEVALLYLVAIPGLWRLFQFLPYLQMAIVGRRYAYFIVQKPDTQVANILMQYCNIQAPQRLLPHDEMGFVSVSTLIIFIACKRGIAPISYHELLMGPDIIKSIRLSDVMLTRDWMILLISFMVKVVAVLVHTTILLLAVAAVDIAFFLIYLTTTQSTRLLVLRRFELQEIFSDILTTWETLSPQADPVVTRMLAEGVSSAELMLEMEKMKRRQPNDKFITLINCVTSLRRQGLFTSPGEVLPPVF